MDYIVNLLTIKAILFGLMTLLFVQWLISRLRYNLPPGPLPLPFVGNLHQFKTDRVHEQLFEWSKKYGPVLSIYLGQTLVLAINDIHSVTEVLVKKGADFAGRLISPSLNIITDGGKDIAFGQYGPAWKLHRRIATKALRHFLVREALEEKVHKAVRVSFEEMKKQQNPFDPTKYIDFMMGNILFGLCFGGTYNFNDPYIARLIQYKNDMIQCVFSGNGILENRIPILQYVYETHKMKWFKAAVDEILGIFRARPLEHSNTFDKENIRDFTDTLILARREAETDPDETDLDKLTETHIVEILKDIFFAGIDTSRHTLRYAILHMVAYPHIQTKVQEEIDQVVGPDELPKLCHRPQLNYTEAVLHESMRLSSVGPAGLPHRSLCKTSVCGYDVPKNTMVIINHWALHHDPNV